MLATPFDAADAVDEQGLGRLVEHVVAAGPRALAVGGLASEAHALTAAERRRVAEVVVDRVDGRVGVLVAVSAESTVIAAALAAHAEATGADAVMVAPPAVTSASRSELERHYRSIADHVAMPLMVQDAPAFLGTELGAEFIGRLVADCDNVRYVKVEADPIAPAVAAMRAELDDRVAIFAGSGGLHLLDAYRAGATGSIPGCDIPEVFVVIDRLIDEGEHDRAGEAFELALPLLAVENASLDVFVASTKRLLRERGVIVDARMRAPGGVSDDVTDAALAAYRSLRERWPEMLPA